MNFSVAGKVLPWLTIAGLLVHGAFQEQREVRSTERVAVALETMLADAKAAKEPAHARCERPGKETVDLGVPEPCGGDSMGQCIRGLPLSEWEARCKAGKGLNAP